MREAKLTSGIRAPREEFCVGLANLRVQLLIGRLRVRRLLLLSVLVFHFFFSFIFNGLLLDFYLFRLF